MSIGQRIQTIIEVLLAVAVILSMVYEPILIKWEEKQKQKVIKAWKQRRRLRGGNANV